MRFCIHARGYNYVKTVYVMCVHYLPHLEPMYRTYDIICTKKKSTQNVVVCGPYLEENIRRGTQLSLCSS